jgi:hypothetical protein
MLNDLYPSPEVRLYLYKLSKRKDTEVWWREEVDHWMFYAPRKNICFYWHGRGFYFPWYTASYLHGKDALEFFGYVKIGKFNK